MYKLLVLMVSMLLLSGCMTVGNRNIDNVGSYLSLREEKSTKANVYEVFGQPHDVRSTTDGESLWVYYKIYSRPSAWSYVPFVGLAAGGSARETTFAYFAFDLAGTLQKIQTKNDNDYENSWAGIGRAISRVSDKSQSQRVQEEMVANGFSFDDEIAKSVSAVRDE